MKTVIKNGKEYSEQCVNCGENKGDIQFSQRHKDPIYCVTGTMIAEGGWEADQEYDHHRFVRTLKQKAAEEADELAYLEQMDGFTKFMEGKQ